MKKEMIKAPGVKKGNGADLQNSVGTPQLLLTRESETYCNLPLTLCLLTRSHTHTHMCVSNIKHELNKCKTF